MRFALIPNARLPMSPVVLLSLPSASSPMVIWSTHSVDSRPLEPCQDTVYADIAETTKCQVVSVTKETKQHDYFGLNCLNSQVLASGLKSSTFEKLHSVPAFWMQVMGRVLGIKRASAMGDYIADLVHKMNLI